MISFFRRTLKTNSVQEFIKFEKVPAKVANFHCKNGINFA